MAAGESIASEGNGEYLYVEGQVRSITGEAVVNAIIDTWETDSYGKSMSKQHSIHVDLTSLKGPMIPRGPTEMVPIAGAAFALTRTANTALKV